MATIHGIAAHGEGGLRGVQAGQRDWSPFVAHFTSYRAMAPLRSVVAGPESPREVADLLVRADAESMAIARLIADSGELRASSPAPGDGVPACVCFSECSLPGLLSHCERYGRVGWVFRKSALWDVGARPCLYVDDDAYALLAGAGRGAEEGSAASSLFGLANVYRPPGAGRVQDYTHEREWRLFRALDLAQTPPELLLAPRAHAEEMAARFPSGPCLPLDVLHEWGV